MRKVDVFIERKETERLTIDSCYNNYRVSVGIADTQSVVRDAAVVTSVTGFMNGMRSLFLVPKSTFLYNWMYYLTKILVDEAKDGKEDSTKKKLEGLIYTLRVIERSMELCFQNARKEFDNGRR
jgi:hypothetical protein